MSYPRLEGPRSAVSRFLRSLPGIASAVAAILLALGLALASSTALRQGSLHASILLAVSSLILAALIAVTVVPVLVAGINLQYLRNLRLVTLTRTGLFFLLLVLILSLASVSTGNNLLILVLAVLLASILVSGALSSTILSGVDVSLNVPDNVFAGELTRLVLSVRNGKRFFPAISVLLGGYRQGSAREGSILTSNVYFPFVGPRQSESHSLQAVFDRRGIYGLSGFRAQTGFPFGFFDKAREIPAKGQLVVFPRRVDVRSEFQLFPFLRGIQDGPRRGTGDGLYTMRPYTGSDDARFIHWKASAKLGELMVKEFSEEIERRVCVCLDNSVLPPDVGADQFEKAVELAASLCAHFIAEGSGVELVLCDKETGFDDGREHLQEVLTELATVEAKHSFDEFLERLRKLQRPVGNVELFKLVFSTRPVDALPIEFRRGSQIVWMKEL